jgi:hypothetical protein
MRAPTKRGQGYCRIALRIVLLMKARQHRVATGGPAFGASPKGTLSRANRDSKMR